MKLLLIRERKEKMKEIYYMLLAQEHSINWLYIIRDQYKFTKLSFLLIISTQLLTVLIMCVILHAEQRKREKIKGSQGVPKIGKSSEVLSDR